LSISLAGIFDALFCKQDFFRFLHVVVCIFGDICKVSFDICWKGPPRALLKAWHDPIDKSAEHACKYFIDTAFATSRRQQAVRVE
jgi:hypothetical protein